MRFLYRYVMKISDRQPKISDSLKYFRHLQQLGGAAAPPSTPSNTPMTSPTHAQSNATLILTPRARDHNNNKKAVLSQGNCAMPQMLFLV